MNNNLGDKSSQQANNQQPPEAGTTKKKFTSQTSVVGIRLTPAELTELERECEKTKLKPSQYAKHRYDSGTVTVRSVDKSYDQFIYELNKIGVNLNQVISLYRNFPDPNFLLKEVVDTTSDMKRLMAEIRAKLA